MRIAVAMSGGIDSSVAAYLLKRAGMTIEGVFMQNWDARIEEGDDNCNQCPIEADYADALKVAKSLEIPLHRVNYVREYWNSVFERSLNEYTIGNTPNPDILCNKEIKLGKLLNWCKQGGFSRLATGHYAKIVEYSDKKWIGRAANRFKDQSYFLSSIDQSIFDQIDLPLSLIPTKEKVREIAQQNGWSFLLKKAESMGLCFVGEKKRFRQFLAAFANPKELTVLDIDTNRYLGKTDEFITIGQSVRIPGLAKKYYSVTKSVDTIYASSNLNHPKLRPKEIIIEADFFKQPESSNLPISCSIRSQQKHGNPILCIKPLDCRNTLLSLTSSDPFVAPAPGQVAVLYQHLPDGNEIIIGSGLIKEKGQ